MIFERLPQEEPPKLPEGIKGIFLDVESLAEELRMIRERENKVRVGMIEGSFNVIHTGHLQFFTEAKKRCDMLVVLVERPQSIRQSKGYGNSGRQKPLISLGDKLRTLKNFQEYSVDWLNFAEDAEAGKRFAIREAVAHTGVDYILVNPYTLDYQDQRTEELYIRNEALIKPDVLFVSAAETHLESKIRRAERVGYALEKLPEFPKQALPDRAAKDQQER